MSTASSPSCPDPALLAYSSLLGAGAARGLHPDDLPPLPSHLRAPSSASWFTRRYRGFIQSEKSSTLRFVLCTIAQAQFIFLAITKLILCILSFIGPYFLQQLIQYSSSSSDLQRGCILVGAFALSMIVQAVIENYYDIKLTLFKLRLKSGLSSLLVENASAMRNFEFQFQNLNESVITNMMQVDLDRVCDFINNLNEIWNLPLLIAIACWMLYRNLKEAFLVGISIIPLMIPFNVYISSLIGRVTTKLMMHKDDRISFISQIIHGIVSVKMQGYEKDMAKLTMEHRDQEFRQLRFRKYLDCIFVFTWAVMPFVVPLLTFVVAVYRGVKLSVADTFLTLSLLRMLVYPLNCIPWVINSMVDSSVSLVRISGILRYDASGSSEEFECVSSPSAQSILLNEAVFRYSAPTINEVNSTAVTDALLESASTTDDSFEIGPVTLKCEPGCVVGVVGAVGSGKRSLLLGLLVRY